MAIDSFNQSMSDAGAGAPAVATDTIDVAWQQLHTSEAYWTGYLGMLVGSLVYSFLVSLVFTVISYGGGFLILIVGPPSFTALVAIVGGVVFLVVRAINSSLGWLLSSRYAATTAACLTGLLVLFLPLLANAEALSKGVGYYYICFGPVMLIVFLQAGAWLAIGREIRKFEQRVAFNAAHRSLPKDEFRFGIGSLLICTFWLAGMMAIFSAAAELNESRESNIYFFAALFISIFLSFGFTVMLIWGSKIVRALKKKVERDLT